jgi:hypothetical protein
MCRTVVNGCKDCTPDTQCNKFLTPGCKYNPFCTECAGWQGFFKDSNGGCCKVKNCATCSNIDPDKCHECQSGHYLSKAQHNPVKIDSDAKPSDLCLTDGDCRVNKFVYENKRKITGFTIGKVQSITLAKEIASCEPCMKYCIDCNMDVGTAAPGIATTGTTKSNKCKRCYKFTTDAQKDEKRVPFYENAKHQCCEVQGCGDCGEYNGQMVGIDSADFKTTPKLDIGLCLTCDYDYCFPNEIKYPGVLHKQCELMAG